MWEQHDKFFPMLEETWRAAGTSGNMEEFQRKLEEMSRSLADWGTKEFGHVSNELRKLKARLLVPRSTVGRVGPTEEEKVVEDRIVDLNIREEIMWRQRSRIQWLVDGDGNTIFFHLKATNRRRRNRINELRRDDGTMCTDEEEIGSMATVFL